MCANDDETEADDTSAI